jgi:hypothetical protein
LFAALQRLRRLAGFPGREQWYALRALGLLAGVRVALWILPFGRVRVIVDRLAPAPRPPHAAPDATEARAVRRAVDRAARSIPGSACLAQSITAELLLRRAGQMARLSIGVAPDGTPLDAHAWVESAGVLVTGDHADLGRYRTLIVFGDDAPAGGAA